MPIFEYRCSECGAKFEELVFGRGQHSTACKSCGSREVNRLFSTFAAQSSSSNGGACYNQTAGICQAGGGAAP
jgi:putative FmdB family regulatory protein